MQYNLINLNINTFQSIFYSRYIYQWVCFFENKNKSAKITSAVKSPVKKQAQKAKPVAAKKSAVKEKAEKKKKARELAEK